MNILIVGIADSKLGDQTGHHLEKFFGNTANVYRDTIHENGRSSQILDSHLGKLGHVDFHGIILINYSASPPAEDFLLLDEYCRVLATKPQLRGIPINYHYAQQISERLQNIRMGGYRHLEFKGSRDPETIAQDLIDRLKPAPEAETSPMDMDDVCSTPAD